MQRRTTRLADAAGFEPPTASINPPIAYVRGRLKSIRNRYPMRSSIPTISSLVRDETRSAQVVQLLQINTMKLLHIDSSILGEGSVSRQLTAKLVAAARSKHRDVQVTYRDLVAQPVGHLTGLHLAAAQGVKPESSALQQDVKAGLTDLESFLAADTVIVGAPMYNFAISSQLKAWIDRIAVAGKTFRYTEKGPEGLAGGKKVFIVSSRGGFYSQGTPTAFLDHQETYLKNLFGFLGVTDIEFVRAEGLAAGDDNRTKGLNGANGAIAAAFA
jgi:FMN-dependent NADH-azoreductase